MATDRLDAIDQKHTRQIDKIVRSTLTTLMLAEKDGGILESDAAIFAQGALSLEVGAEIFRASINAIAANDEVLARRLNSAVANIMYGLFAAGGLVLTSDSLKKQFGKDRTANALRALADLGSQEDDAIRYALTQPLSRPLNKRVGVNAYAERIVDKANEWIVERGGKGDLTSTAIAKRLQRRPGDFPPSDKWPK
ncbi:hypothetical protein MKK58_09500 [Methylobacterium sp. J-078]|uniref:hypothetical protein n=1 Tax=Methylobacterium sp. J-078 TaxID=2836657 RepID=UPI001FBA028E|nr:hypothetical protein [Methylobacterium sp. J-078]MCJ2044761.1 hypothetical protein [Methylobacterium sp. J-078]